MLKKILISCAVFCSISIYSQQFRAGEVYVKVKESQLGYFENKLLKDNSSFMTYYDLEKIEALVKKNSSSAKPFGKLSKYEKEVRKIYLLTFSPNQLVLEKINDLKNSGLFDLVEPAYVFDVMSYQPNDPQADSTLPANGGNNQYKMHNFYGAWAIEKGDTNLKIGVVDTGVNFNQEDSQANLFYNRNDSINGLNDDANTYFDVPLIDDFRGWDIADWDNDPSLNGSSHGAEMISVIAATPDNNLALTGTGFNCRYVPYKAAPDANPNLVSHGFDGILMAAEQGCKVINCSWGTTEILPQIFEDVCNYAVYNLDALVISAAGNGGNSVKYYPATYESVVSVTGLFRDSTFLFNSANFNYEVDLSAVGDAILMSDGSDNDYKFDKGTSVSTAVVSGLAGLVRSHFPQLSAAQVKKQLEVTADYIDTVQAERTYDNKMGKMINPVRALTDTISPGIQLFASQLIDINQNFNKDGEIVNLNLAFINYLRQSNNVTLTLTPLTANFDIVQNTISLPNIASLDTLMGLTNFIELDLFPSADTIEEFVIRLDYSDNQGYRDHDFLVFKLKPAEVTALATNENSKIQVFPSIVLEDFDVEGIEAEDFELKIFTMSGNEIMTKKLNNSTSQTVSLPANLQNGNYLVKISSEKTTQNFKITKLK
jgi:serine protease